MDEKGVGFKTQLAELKKQSKKLTLWLRDGHNFTNISPSQLNLSGTDVLVYDDGGDIRICIDVSSVVAIGYK